MQNWTWECLNQLVKCLSTEVAAVEQFLSVREPLEGGRGPQCPSPATSCISSIIEHRPDPAFWQPVGTSALTLVVGQMKVAAVSQGLQCVTLQKRLVAFLEPQLLLHMAVIPQSRGCRPDGCILWAPSSPGAPSYSTICKGCFTHISNVKPWLSHRWSIMLLLQLSALCTTPQCGRVLPPNH